MVWIRGGTAPPDAARTIDGDGLVLAPGFIDAHNPSDLSAFVSPDMSSAIRQGVTQWQTMVPDEPYRPTCAA